MRGRGVGPTANLVLAGRRHGWTRPWPVAAARQRLSRRRGPWPTGTLTFLFTDIVGSTELWEKCPFEMRLAVEAHDRTVRAAVDGANGYVFSNGGDGFGAAFARSADACSAAIDAQQRLGLIEWPRPVSMGVRMGIHTGEAEERDGNYFGVAVNRASRVAGTATAGQIVISLATEQIVRPHLPATSALTDLGVVNVAGITAPLQVFALEAPGLPPSPPPATGATRAFRKSNRPPRQAALLRAV